MRSVIGWLVGIVAGAVVAVVVLLLFAWAFGNSDFAAKMTSMSIIFSIAAGVAVAVKIKRLIAPPIPSNTAGPGSVDPP